MNRPTMGPAALALAVATLGALALGAAPAGAARVCTPVSRQRLAPHLTSPCDGATVPLRRAVGFTAFDRDPMASAHAPYLNLQTTRALVDGHLALNRDGNGVFAQMTAVKGRPDMWTLTATSQPYASWWDNHRGTYYVQVEQVDPRAQSGIVYGPITTVRVP